MSDWSEKDTKLLLQLFESRGKSITTSFRVISRNGSILMILPKNRSLALKALKLYEPQSSKAKLFIKFTQLRLRFFSGLGMKCIYLEVGENSVVATHFTSDEIGILLGNPNAKYRRGIIYHINDGEEYVTKIGFNESADSVAQEALQIDSLPHYVKGRPLIEKSETTKVFSSYTVKYFNGDSPAARDDLEVMTLLKCWESGGELVSFNQTSVYERLFNCDMREEEEQFVQSVAKIRVRQAYFHGDFAPWNVKRNATSGKILVVDWEHSSSSGVGVWDWLHYLIQRNILVFKKSADEMVEFILQWMESETGIEYLDYFGWRENSNACFGSYLLYAHYVLEIDRRNLLQCWKNKR